MKDRPQPSLIENGEYARAKRIKFDGDQHDMSLEAVLNKFESLIAKIRQPMDKVTLRCGSISTEKGEFSACEVSFQGDSEGS
jgi:hypothetical protein